MRSPAGCNCDLEAHSRYAGPVQPDWQPHLSNDRVILRPLQATDLDALHAAAADPLVWAQHSEPNRHERAVFERFFAGAMASGGALVALEPGTGRVIGSSRYYDWDPASRSVVVGYTFLARDHWGTGTNRVMKDLMIAHAFRWAETVWFHVSPGNHRSQRALEKLGAVLDREELVPVGGVMSPRRIYRVTRP